LAALLVVFLAAMSAHGQSATHTVVPLGYTSPGTFTVTNTFFYPNGTTLTELYWYPVVPENWTVSNVRGQGSPEMGWDGYILWGGVSALPANPIKMYYDVTVPPGETGAKEIVGYVYYNLGDGVQEIMATADPLVLRMIPSVTTWPTASGITYGQALSAATLSGGSASTSGDFAFTAPATFPAAGTNSFSVTFTPSDESNYTTVTGSVSVVVAKATPSVTTWPTAATITNGQSLARATLSGGVVTNVVGTSVPGSFAYDAPATVPGAGIYNAAVTFTPIDAVNYNPVTGGSVRVNRFAVANPNAAGTRQGQTLSINVTKLLFNDTDVDGDTLTVTGVNSLSAHSRPVLLSGGYVTYTPADFAGTDTFTYVVSDAYGAMSEGTVTVSVTAGTSGPVSLNIVGGPVIAGGQFSIRFAGIPGYTYTIEATDTLTPAAWQKVINLTAPNTSGTWGIGVFEFSESTGGAMTRFYRTVWPAY
jgi:hypothetical protein